MSFYFTFRFIFYLIRQLFFIRLLVSHGLILGWPWPILIHESWDQQTRKQLTNRKINQRSHGKINTKSSYKRHRQGIKFSMDTCSDIEHELIPWHLLYSISFVFPLVVVFPFLWWITCLFFFLWEHSRVVGVANQKTTS